jgi:hypothetical protein
MTKRQKKTKTKKTKTRGESYSTFPTRFRVFVNSPITCGGQQP